LKRARDALEECKATFKVKQGTFDLIFFLNRCRRTDCMVQVPKKVTRQRKDGHVRAREDDDEEMLLLDAKPPKRTASQTQPQASPSKKPAAADSDTDDSDADADQSPSKDLKKGQVPPTPARSMSPAIDPGRAPGRIIGTTYPLKDFQKNISQGDVVSKAVEDLGFVIKEIVMKPFSSRRNDELLQCMTAFRDTALQVGWAQVHTWARLTDCAGGRDRCME
jgi:ATP-dependent DNA helicase 2 subunit 2